MDPILANTLSPEPHYLVWLLYLFFWGLLFSLLGFLVGWLLWRHKKAEAQRLNHLNQELLEQHNAFERKFRAIDRTFSRATSDGSTDS
ncbi:MAG: hypothetical protein AAF514_02765 [Verrucomicrobiota bacterium]